MALADILGSLGGSLAPESGFLVPTNDSLFQTPDIGSMGRSGGGNRFGLGWNVSDILGGLGDALSVGAGGQANYLNQVQRDRFGNAIDLFADDPSAGLKMMAQAAGPEAATNYYQKFLTGKNNEAVNRINAGKAGVEARKAQDEFDKNTRERLASMLRLGESNPSTYAMAREQAINLAKNRGMTDEQIEALGIPATATVGFADKLTRSGLTPKEYAQLKDTEAYRDATLDLNRDKALAQTILQGRGRQAQEAIKEAGRNARAATEEAGRNRRAAAARTAEGQRANAARADKAISNVTKQFGQQPGFTVQSSQKTGRVRYSLDGGKTWINAN